MYLLQFDGLYREVADQSNESGRAGFMGYGWLILKDDRLIGRGAGVFAHKKHAASNLAEYLALIEGLEALTDLNPGDAPVEVRGDAKCVIDQMLGLAEVSSPPTRRLHRRAKKLARRFTRLQWIWVPRRANKAADVLARQAIRRMRITPDAYRSALSSLSRSTELTLVAPMLDLRVFTV